MTQTKIEAKMNELLRKHGDIMLIVYHDSRTYREVANWKLSNIPVRNTADFNEVERILKEGAPRHIKVKINQ